jgi:2-oxoglutarate dehydrogenase E2 component (dihydrolipoamide succinyltransferase)
MPIEIKVPDLGESVTEATVGRWLKREGDAVKVGEPLVELETDKVNLEVGAERNGVLAKIARQQGEDVRIGDMLGVIDDTAVAVAAPAQPAAKADAAATPVARNAAQALGVDISQVPTSGGRVTKTDVEKFVEAQRTIHAAPVAPIPTTSLPPAPPAASRPALTALPVPPPVAPNGGVVTYDPISYRKEERLRLSRRRRTIAQRLLEAKQTTAMLTTFNEVDMTGVQQYREANQQAFTEKHGVKLGIMSFFVKACVAALKEFPRLNAELDGDDMLLKHYYDIGIAVGAAEGLVVPVLRNADAMSFAEVERAIKGYAKQADEGTLSLEDLRGGTFTITNGGIFGSLMSTPILNTPQVAILGMHKIQQRPIAVDGQVVIRPMMYIALSYDHRIVDGRESVQFLVRVKELLGNVNSLLIGG